MTVLPIRDMEPFLAGRPAVLARGPLAVILVEDDTAVAATLRHHLDRGFRHILLMSDLPQDLPDAMAEQVTQLRYDPRRPAAHVDAVNAVIRAVPAGTWLYYASTPNSCSIRSARPAASERCWPFTPRNGAARCCPM